MAAILLHINTNAHKAEPETRYIRLLFGHIWAQATEIEEMRAVIAEHVTSLAELQARLDQAPKFDPLHDEWFLAGAIDRLKEKNRAIDDLQAQLAALPCSTLPCARRDALREAM